MLKGINHSLNEGRERKLARRISALLVGMACGLWSIAPVMAEPAANALPEGGSISSGTAYIVKDAANSVMDINQTSNCAIIDWQSFNVGRDATVNFNHMKLSNGSYVQDNSAITLNRVGGNNMSEIYGHINSVGSVVLVNPNGILFGGSSEVNAAGIVASTADVNTSKFMDKGELLFVQDNETNNNITMLGKMNASINGDYLASGEYQQHLASLKDSTLSATLNMGSRQKATAFSAVGNKIMLVADGDVAVGDSASLTAVTQTTLGGAASTTDTSDTATTRKSAIIIRADQNADDVALWDSNIEAVAGSDYNKTEKFTESSKGFSEGVVLDEATGGGGSGSSGSSTSIGSSSTETTGGTYLKTAKVYLKNDANNLQSQNVSVYWDSDVVGSINGTWAAYIGPTTTPAPEATFTQKDYSKYADEAAAIRNHVHTGKVSYYTNSSSDGINNVVANTKTDVNTTFATLVNDVYQLQAIQDVQEIGAITDGTETLCSYASNKEKYYGNLDATYALGTDIDASVTAKWLKDWWEEVGFNPIGNTDSGTEFTGGFTGNGGSNTYGIYDLTIKRSTERNVGLFATTKGAHIWDVAVIDPIIEGDSNVGGIVGTAQDTYLSNVTMRKRVLEYDGKTTTTANQNNVSGDSLVGGIAGAMLESTMDGGINGGTVYGSESVGGLVGQLRTTKTGMDYSIGGTSQNKGYYSANEDVAQGYGAVSGKYVVGGLVGYLDADDGLTKITGNSYSNGQVSGKRYVGGIVGRVSGDAAAISHVYNSNEATPGSEVIEDASARTSSTYIGAGTSPYGKVTGSDDYVGGLVGHLSDGTVSESYNAGNVSGDSCVGGLVGDAGSGTLIINSYNADTNTMLKTSTNAMDCYGFTYGTDNYVYDADNDCWYKNNDTSTALTAEQVLAEAPESGRLYNNRLAFRDATVTGKSSDVGGVVGFLDGGTIKNTYSAGKITSESAAVGGLIGCLDAGTVEGDNFYVTTQNITNANLSGSQADEAVGAAKGDGPIANVSSKTLWEAMNPKGDAANGVSWTGNSDHNDQWVIYRNAATPLLTAFSADNTARMAMLPYAGSSDSDTPIIVDPDNPIDADVVIDYDSLRRYEGAKDNFGPSIRREAGARSGHGFAEYGEGWLDGSDAAYGDGWQDGSSGAYGDGWQDGSSGAYGDGWQDGTNGAYGTNGAAAGKGTNGAADNSGSENSDGTNAANGTNGTNGAKTTRYQRRHLTVEDTGINLDNIVGVDREIHVSDVPVENKAALSEDDTEIIIAVYSDEREADDKE